MHYMKCPLRTIFILTLGARPFVLMSLHLITPSCSFKMNYGRVLNWKSPAIVILILPHQDPQEKAKKQKYICIRKESRKLGVPKMMTHSTCTLAPKSSATAILRCKMSSWACKRDISFFPTSTCIQLRWRREVPKVKELFPKDFPKNSTQRKTYNELKEW